MDDVTSGFNIGTNITTDPWFNDLVGFSEKELREMLTYYKEQGALPMSVDDAVTMMKPNYDNYCFSENKLADCPSRPWTGRKFLRHQGDCGARRDSD